ncbi:hypothetical protein Tco_0972505 [Tanacetum coccineum]
MLHPPLLKGAPSRCSIPHSCLLITREKMRVISFEEIFSLPSVFRTSPAINPRCVWHDVSNKMQKFILKQQLEIFYVSNSEGLHKGYDRFQSLLSQLEIHGAGVFTEDTNQKFLRSLPASWSQVSLIMRTKPGVDSLSFDDLYNNLRVFEHDVKGSTRSSTSTQNVAFVSSSTSSTNDVSTAYGVYTSSDHNSTREKAYSSLHILMISYGFGNGKWPMISMRMNKFYKKTERKLYFDAKEPVGFDKTKEIKYMKVFLSYENEVLESVFDSRSSDVEDSLVYDRFSKVKGMHAVPPPMIGIYMPPKSDFGIDKSNFTYGPKQSKTSESAANTSDSVSCESNSNVETLESVPKPVVNEPKAVSKPKVWSDSPIIEEYESDSDDEYVIKPSKE